MSRYFIKEHEYSLIDSVTARGKARDDAERIVISEGYEPLEVLVRDTSKDNRIVQIIWQFRTASVWRKATSGLKAGDILFYQCPVDYHTVFLPNIMKRLRKRGVRTVALVHDMERFRHMKNEATSFYKRVKLRYEEKALRQTSALIIHNDVMKQRLTEAGFEADRLYPLYLFDYLTGEQTAGDNGRISFGKPVAIAGNLMKSKAGYVYDLPSDVKFNLYGMNYEDEGKNNIEYKGVVPPEELPSVIEGSFGLVWDGPSSGTCEGPMGEYLKVNDPHKVSLYLTSSMPVIIWDQAAMADYLGEKGCCIKVSSLDEISDKIKDLDEEGYSSMREAAKAFAGTLRRGDRLRSVLKETEEN